jgi:hypothetical protein
VLLDNSVSSVLATEEPKVDVSICIQVDDTDALVPVNEL